MRITLIPVNGILTCQCGYRWELHGTSGRTRCRQCEAAIYVPAKYRPSVERPSPAPVQRAVQPAAVVSPAPPVSRPASPAPKAPRSTPRRATRPPGPDPLTSLLDVALKVAEARSVKAPKVAAQAPQPAPVAPPPPATVQPLLRPHWAGKGGKVCPMCKTGLYACGLPGCPMPPGK